MFVAPQNIDLLISEAEKEALDRETELARKSRFRSKWAPEGKRAQRRLFKKS